MGDAITSDIAQKLSALGAQLSAHVAEQMTPLIKDFNVDVTPFFKRMSPVFEKLAAAARAAMPPNWEPEGIGAEVLLRRGETHPDDRPTSRLGPANRHRPGARDRRGRPCPG